MSSDPGVGESTRLRSMAAEPPLIEYLADLWRRREFTMTLATGSLKAKHLDTSLGNLWHVLNPALLMTVYFVVFGLLLNTRRGVDNFLGFLAVGVFTFSFSQRTVTACGASIRNNIGLIRSLQFPRAVLPISTVVRELSGYGFAAVVMIGVLLLTGEMPQGSWFLAPVIVVLLTVFSTGLGLIVARLTDTVRDIANVIPYVFRITFYLSGIIFSVESFVTESAVAELGIGMSAEQLRRFFVIDPFFTYVALLRDSLMVTYEAEHLVELWIAAFVFPPITFMFGLLYFRAGEKSYGRG